jgi:Protein of unknown function (DUF2281)
MTVDAEILQTIAQMPEALKQQLLVYAKSLIEIDSQGFEEKSSKKKRRSGILQGTFGLPLPADFDAPLEDFGDYME